MRATKQFTRLRHVVAAAALVALTACGGGGGGGSDPQAQSSSSKVSLSGVAAKGLLKNALVTAYLPDAKGQPGQKLAAILSSKSDGTYTLKDLPAGQVILVVVTRNADPKDPTVMADEATDQDVPVAEGFQLLAATVLSTSNGASDVLHVTPFSTMSVVKARAALKTSGQFDAQTVVAYNADVRRFAGFDVFSDKPTFDASGHKPLNASALALASISTLAQSQDTNSCPALQGMTDEQGITSVKAACQVVALANAGTSNAALIDKLVAAQQTTATNEGYTGQLPPAPAPQPPVPENVPVQDIAAAKELVTYLRSDVPFIVGSTGDTLRTRLEQVQSDLIAAINPLDGANVHLLDAMFYASQRYANREYGIPVSSVRFDSSGRQVGCTFYTDTSYTIEAEVPAARRTQACRVTYFYRLKTPASGSSPAVYTALQHAIFLEPGADSDSPTGGSSEFKFRTSLLWQDGTLDSAGAFIPNWQTGQHAMLAAGGANDPVSSNLVATVRGSWQVVEGLGDVPTSLSLVGDLAPAFGRVNDQIVAKGRKAMADLVLTPTVRSDKFGALGVTGGFSAVDQQGAVSSVKLQSGSKIQGWLTLPDFSGDTFLAKLDDLSLTLVLQGDTASGSSIKGTLALSQFIDTSATNGMTPSQRIGEQLSVPAQMSFEGMVSRGSQQIVNGTVLITLQSVGTPNETHIVKVNASIQVPSRPNLVVKNLVLTETSSNVGIAGQLEQGAMWVSVNGTVDTNDVLKLDLLSDAGVSLAVDSSSTTNLFPLMRNGHIVGELDTHAGQLTYADHSYERF